MYSRQFSDEIQKLYRPTQEIQLYLMGWTSIHAMLFVGKKLAPARVGAEEEGGCSETMHAEMSTVWASNRSLRPRKSINEWLGGGPARSPLFAPPYMPQPPRRRPAGHTYYVIPTLLQKICTCIICAKTRFCKIFPERECEWMNNAHVQMLLKHVCESIQKKNQDFQK